MGILRKDFSFPALARASGNASQSLILGTWSDSLKVKPMEGWGPPCVVAPEVSRSQGTLHSATSGSVNDHKSIPTSL